MNEQQVTPRPAKRKPAAERYLELWLFRSRWLMAPFYVGLVFALAAMFFVFVQAAIKDLSHGIIGMAVDGTMSGPHYEPGFGRGKGASAKKAKTAKAAAR